MHDAASIELPAWAQVRPGRAAHIARVTALLEQWARTMALDSAIANAWRDAGRGHDALRDAPESELRVMLNDYTTPAPLLHGPAAAKRFAADGETRQDVLEAIAHHTVGHPEWGRTGRALYMADYLEPGRPFARAERARLAATVPNDFDATFREVVRQRVERAQSDGHGLHPQTAALWNAIR
jgi:2-amino-4-hydroxy-6-hydroxymethyldihydropteridine diphosphokinase